jgi:hypothetical protein
MRWYLVLLIALAIGSACFAQGKVEYAKPGEVAYAVDATAQAPAAEASIQAPANVQAPAKGVHTTCSPNGTCSYVTETHTTVSGACSVGTYASASRGRAGGRVVGLLGKLRPKNWRAARAGNGACGNGGGCS